MDIKLTSQFKQDIKKQKSSRQGSALKVILQNEIIPNLLIRAELAAKYKDQSLIGDWIPARECHLFADTLLIYRIAGDSLILVRLGSHAELFGKTTELTANHP